jgi:dienelactone hydrolase
MRHLAPLIVLALAPLAAGQDRPPLPPEQARAAFLKLLDRPKVPADERPTAEPKAEGKYRVERLTIATETKADGAVERVPVLVVRPPREEGRAVRRPVMIVLHGTGGNKDGVRSWLDEFAGRGFVAVAVDARYHGGRVPGAKGAEAYVAAITTAWRTAAGTPREHPFYYDTCWDLWRLIDWLQARPDVDPDRIGMLGVSMGGIQTWLAASVDRRVKVAAPLIAAQSFRWSLENDQWQGRARTIQAAHDAAAKDLGEPMVNRRVCRELWGKVIPGILDDFDCPNLLPLFADRYLFLANGDTDPNCPIGGARVAFAAAEAAFAKAGARERLQIHVGAGVGHRVTDEHRAAAVAFCAAALR